MAARSGQRVKLLYLLKILQTETDDDHPLSAGELCAKLERYGVTAERKSIYSDIDALIGCGYDIINTRTPRSGYFLASRDFELPEVFLLTDAVRSANFISAKKTRELTAKLDALLSIHQAQRREKGIYIDDARKCKNEELYYLIDGISTAIAQKKKITFRYGVRTLKEDRSIEPKIREHIVSPYAMTWQDDHYYLIGNYEKYDNLAHFRIDRMRGLSVTEQPVRPFSEVCEYRDFFDVMDYSRRLFGMQGGVMEKITLRCQNGLIEQVADRFGDRIFLTDVRDGAFTFSVDAAISEALVTWIINFGDKIEVLAPNSLREQVIHRAKAVLQLYQ